MLIEEYIQYDAKGLAALIKNGQISAQEALDCAIKRIESVNPMLNAVIADCDSFAKKCLKSMKGNEPFYGVPLLVKDLGFELQNAQETCGSQFFSKNIGTLNSDFMSHLLKLGFIPFAKTNTPELGLSSVTEPKLFGPCHNPYDLSKTSGGSSGGSAAAVASGIAPIATASDGGGSIRIPASCCGLLGVKPSQGVIPTGPRTQRPWSGMATNFVLTRSFRDAELIFKSFLPFASWSLLDKSLGKNLTFLRLKGAFADVPIATPCLDAVNLVEKWLVKQGHTVKTRCIDLDVSQIGQAVLAIISANIFTKIREQENEMERAAQTNELEPATWEFYQRGKEMSAADLIRAESSLFQKLEPLRKVLNEVDFILTPALAQLPLPIGTLSTELPIEDYLQKNAAFSPFTGLFNQAGAPAITLPVMTYNKMPISVQFAAARGEDIRLFALGKLLKSHFIDFEHAITPKASPK